MSYIYACLFSNGLVKVGRSDKPERRINQHKERVSCFGVTIKERKIVKCAAENVLKIEKELIHRCIIKSNLRYKREWFDGLDYQDLCLWIDKIENDLQTRTQDKADKSVKPTSEQSDFINLRENSRYIICWPSGYILGSHVWVDKTPDLPHWPDSAVMRWDLRDDWHLVWPELIDHPCSLFFAPQHPNRIGDKSFVDWVKSWPESFVDKDYINTMPDNAKKIVISIWSRFG